MARDTITRRDALKYGGAATALAGLAGCSEGGSLGGGGGEETIELIWADWFPEATITLNYTSRKFMDAVEARTDGRVQFDYRPGGQVGGATELMDLLMENAIDCAHVTPSYYSDRLPLTMVGMLPGIPPDVMTGSEAIYDVMVPHKNGIIFEEEWEEYGLRPLLPVRGDPYEISLMDGRVETMEDLEGLKLRSSGGIADLTIEALGATPVQMGGGEIYQALERGTIDGDVNATIAMDIFNTYEVFNHMTSNAQLHTTVLVEAINLDVWNGLPDDVQQIFIEEADRIPSYYGAAIMGLLDKFQQTWEREYDVDVYEIAPDEVERWHSVMQEEVNQPWVQQRDDPEVAQEILDTYKQKVEEYA